MISLIKVSGSPFETGRILGEFGAGAVHEHLLQTDAWATVVRWRGSGRVAEMARLTQQMYPQIWEELQGLAEGLDVPFDDVFLWNCRGDVWAMAPEGCTTVQLPGAEAKRIAHNEDGDPGFAGRCAIAECNIDGSSQFASFVYPGSIPGHSFAVTDAGLAMTVNNLRTLHVDAGLPRMVLTRALLSAQSADQAVALLRDSPRAGGYHLTLADRRSNDILSIEFCSHACSVRAIETPSVHTNHMIHPEMRDFPQITTGSSGYRQRRGNQVLREAARQDSILDPVSILRDTENAQFPIYRNDPRDDDNENTLATADIIVHEDRIDWQVYEYADRPARIRMKDGHPTSGAP